MSKDLYVIIGFSVGALFIFIGLAASYVFISGINHLLIIHFDSYRGIDFLGSKGDLFGVLVAGLFINAVNLFLAWALYNREKFLSRLLGLSSSFVSLLILIAAVVIIKVN